MPMPTPEPNATGQGLPEIRIWLAIIIELKCHMSYYTMELFIYYYDQT